MTSNEAANNYSEEKDFSNGEPATNTRSHETQASYYQNYGPLAHVNTAETRLPAFGGEMQPGLYKSPEKRKIGNAAPLGLSAFALTTFILGCINMQARDITEPNMVVGAAYGYGGLVQLLAGMWEMATGNTFAATALSSYGGFWLSFAVIFTPGGFEIQTELEKAGNGSLGMFYDSLGLFLLSWFIFSTMLVFCTVKSTVVFFTVFLSIDLAFLLLGIGYIRRVGEEPNEKVIKAGGFFAIFSSFMAWYCAFAGMADNSNSFFIAPVFHFPWSEKARASRQKKNEDAV